MGEINAKIHECLRKCFEPHIWKRGVEYFHNGQVSDISVDVVVNGQICIEAIVSGQEEYETTLWFDTEVNEFTDFECSCPYGSGCKHAAALGLAFIESEKINVLPSNNNATDDELARKITAAISDGSSREDIEQLIAQLEIIKEKRPEEKKIQARLLPPKLAIESESEWEKLYIVFSRWDGKLSLFKKNQPYQQASIRSLLEAPQSLTDEQVELLQLVKTSLSLPTNTPTLNYSRFFELVKNTGMKLYDRHWDYSQPNTIRIISINERIKAELSFVEEFNEYFNTKPRFVLKLTYPSKGDFNLIAGKNELLRVSREKIEVYPMPEVLAIIIAKYRPPAFYHNPKPPAKNAPQEIALQDDETTQINTIILAAKQALDLTTTLSPDYEIQEFKDPKKVLNVDFLFPKEALSITALVDYGCQKIDVSDSVFISRAGGQTSFKRRVSYYGNPDTYLLIIDGKKIQYALIDAALEESLYQDLYDSNILPTKIPRFSTHGLTKIMNFYETYWPRLEKRCRDIDCEINFTNDKLFFKSESMRADLSLDIEVKNDWLFFDAAFYLGDNKITLKDLIAFINEDKKFFRHADGQLSKITNIDELKRLVSMLETFQKRQDGGFQGKLYHAPEMQYIATSSKQYTAQYSNGFEAFCQEVKSGKPVKPIRLSKQVREILRPYQIAGVEWFYFLRTYNFAGILADDMGLGKTLQTLILLEKEKTEQMPSLVICPKTLIYNWLSEAKKFTPKMKVGVVDGTPGEREVIIKNAKKYDLLITGYATFKIDNKKYKEAGITFNYCVLDEAQFIKNHATKSAQIVKEVDARYRLALTGTPLENNVSEIWSIFDFLMPGFLGSYKNFSERFHRPIMEKGDIATLELLRKKVECFMLRRTKSEVLTELPPKVIQENFCYLDKAQNVLYQEVLAQVKKNIYQTIEEKGFNKSGIHILAGLTKLRQICNHPNLLLKEKNYRKHESAKLNMFNELVEEAHGNKRKLLVFSQFTEMLDILAAELKAQKIPCLYLSGKTKNRQGVVDKFNTDPDISVFLISLKAGGTGLNLTSADTVIIFDPWWNPSVENQAIDRAHRIGQKKSVNVYKLITKGTIEEKIIALQQKKKGLFDGIIGESKDLFKKLTWDDVQELFK